MHEMIRNDVVHDDVAVLAARRMPDQTSRTSRPATRSPTRLSGFEAEVAS